MNFVPFNSAPPPAQEPQDEKRQMLAKLLMGGLPGALQGKSGIAGLLPSDPLMGMIGGKKGGLFG